MISVIISSFNPGRRNIDAVLMSLKSQTYDTASWQLIIIDNNSTNVVLQQIDISWHPNAVIIQEHKQGLTYSRIRGFNSAEGDIIVMVDDDNVLAADYLQNVYDIFNTHPQLGAVGGKSLPQFETLPPKWLKEFYSNLALRDLGNDAIVESWQNKYPAAAPIGAGMAIRRQSIDSYLKKFESQVDIVSDRTGSSLASGGDNDIVLEIVKSGWQAGYFPQLVLHHIIPENRMQADYIARLVNQTNRSWVKVLENHRINPWKKINRLTLPLRKLKAWFTYGAWKNKANFIRWRGACGLFDGQADIA